MKLQVLVSAVEKEAATLAQNMNLQSDAIIINQTDCFEYEEFVHKGHNIQCYSFNEKGVVLDSAYFPKNLKAEYIICDIQNAYFPAESLYENYKKAGLSFTEEIKNSSENEKKLPNDGEILENSQNLIEKKQIIRKIYDKNKIIEEIVISQNEIKISNKLRNYEYILINLEELN